MHNLEEACKGVDIAVLLSGLPKKSTKDFEARSKEMYSAIGRALNEHASQHVKVGGLVVLVTDVRPAKEAIQTACVLWMEQHVITSAMCPQVVIVPQPASTCAAAVCSAAPRLSPQNITVLSRLAHNRLTQQVPKVTLSEVLVHLADQERHDLLHPLNAAIHAESAAALNRCSQ